MGKTPSPATQRLLDDNPGLKALYKGDSLVGLGRVAFASDDDPLTSTDTFVSNFLAEHADALGVDNADLVLCTIRGSGPLISGVTARR